MEEMILILDFGSQYTQLIARRLRELNVYCEIHPYTNIPTIQENMIGVILSGSPFSVRSEDAPNPDLSQFRNKLPLLGVCYGAQFLAQSNGGSVLPSETREYGRANLAYINQSSDLLKGMTDGSQVWMSHGDTIKELPSNFEIITSTNDVKVAGYEVKGEQTYGIQFHPEVYHSTEGAILLKNFVVGICGSKQDWTPDAFVETTVAELQEKIGDEKVILGLSGGVDSSVSAMLLHKAIGKNLHCIFVDNGLLRKNEETQVVNTFKKKLKINLIYVNAEKEFIRKLTNVSDPEKKRKIIGNLFIKIFERYANKIKNVKFLAQGTLYPDVIESISTGGPSQTIKSHHNVGGLPDYMKLKVVEPLRALFKDEVRRVGKSIGMSPTLLGRHPFPGPGLGIRILGDVTAEKVRILQEVDHIFIQGLRDNNLYDDVWQAGVMLLPVQSVGVMGDERTYENAVALRAVSSTDGMTADWCHLPYEFLAKVSNDIINKVKGINRVTYDISSKPPATIEWE